MLSRKPFKVNLFQVIQDRGAIPLAEQLEEMMDDPLHQRVRRVGAQEFRLEAATLPSADKPYWMLDFCKLRYDGGPGKAARETAIESIELEEGEGFAEETAVLFDPRTGYAAVQYNHHGPRPGTIADYLSIYNVDHPNGYDLRVQLDPSVQARLDSKRIFTKLEIKVAPAALSPEFKARNTSFATALERTHRDYGGDVITITAGFERRTSGTLRIAHFMRGIKDLCGSEEEAARSLKISGRNGVDEPIETIDLLKEKLEFTLRDLAMDDGLRYIRDERWRALERAYNGWRTQRIIPA